MTDNVRVLLFPCPCCGERSLGAPNVHVTCPVCDWRDDPAQSRHPDVAGGANALSLHQARTLWADKRT